MNAGLYSSLTYTLIAYRIYTGNAFDARFALDSWKDAPTAALTLPGLMLLAVLIFSSAWLGFALLILRLGALQTWTLRTHPVIVWLLLSIGLFKFRPARSAMSARACRT